MNQSFILLVAVMFFSTFTSCKKIHWDGKNSESKGVDQLADKQNLALFGMDIPPYCGNKIDANPPQRWVTASNNWLNSLTLTQTANLKQSLREATRQSIANIPASVIEVLKDMQIDLVIHDKAPEVCKTSIALLNESKRKQLEEKFADTKFSEANHFGCFNSPGGTERPTIHIGGDPNLMDQQEKMTQQESFLRRLLVRNIGLVYARFFPRYLDARFINNPDYLNRVQTTANNNNPAIRNTGRMVQESVQNIRNFSANYTKYKASLRDDLLVKDGLGRSEPITRMRELIQDGIVDSTEFDDIIFAEIFDSYYCTGISRLYYESTYKASSENFAKNAKVMIELVTPIVPKPENAANLYRPF